jgi:platelet-activating factor acetylhydrolase
VWPVAPANASSGSWDKNKDFSGFQDSRLAFRAEQLEMRKREIFLAYSAFRRLIQTGEQEDLETMDDLPFDWASWGGDWVRYDDGVSLVGHSFGGATMVSISNGVSDVATMPLVTSERGLARYFVGPFPQGRR